MKVLIRFRPCSPSRSPLRYALSRSPSLPPSSLCDVLTLRAWRSDDHSARMGSRKQERYRFKDGGVLGDGADQREVFERGCREMCGKVLKGYNCCVFAYGQTGSGKTYTVTGGEAYDDRGVAPRCVEEIMDGVKRKGGGSVCVSYVEVYNEVVYDLLAGQGTRSRVEAGSEAVYEIVDAGQGISLLFMGNSVRSIAGTKMNSESSRSHAVFTVMVERSDGKRRKYGRISIVDLAGSESSTCDDDDDVARRYEGGARKEQLKGCSNSRECRSINLSLHHLRRVLRAMSLNSRCGKSAVCGGVGVASSAAAAHVPFRDCALTRVLRGSLSMSSFVTIVACARQEEGTGGEARECFRFAEGAGGIEVEQGRNEVVKCNGKCKVCCEKRGG